jgi:diguanylate cyclase (GGDEF)-like protein
MPFGLESLHTDPVFVAVRFGWQVAVLCGTAAVSSQLVGSLATTAVSERRAAVIDEATGLYSRQYFMRALNAEVARAQRDSRPVHVLLVDIDHFGEFNRHFGIEMGDRLLVEIATSITRAVDEAGDTLVTSNLVARFGGEEFVALLAEESDLPGPPQHMDALRLAERVRAAVAATHVDGAGVTVSVGVASYPASGTSPDDLLDGADAALSKAIEMGGDRVCDTDCDEDSGLVELPDGGHFRDPLEL